MSKADADAEMEVYRGIQGEIGKLAGARQQLISQVNENGMVKQELDLLEDSATVFKLVGPILVKQELGEAKVNVEKRLEFIKNELEKVQNNITERKRSRRKAAKRSLRSRNRCKRPLPKQRRLRGRRRSRTRLHRHETQRILAAMRIKYCPCASVLCLCYIKKARLSLLLLHV